MKYLKVIIPIYDYNEVSNFSVMTNFRTAMATRRTMKVNLLTYNTVEISALVPLSQTELLKVLLKPCLGSSPQVWVGWGYRRGLVHTLESSGWKIELEWEENRECDELELHLGVCYGYVRVNRDLFLMCFRNTKIFLRSNKNWQYTVNRICEQSLRKQLIQKQITLN